MLSMKKTLHFLSCALSTALGAALLGFGMAANWSTTAFKCIGVSGTGAAVVTLKIFTGTAHRLNCSISQQSDDFLVIPQLMKTGGAPVVLHGLLSGFCVICLILSAWSIIVALYNSVSHPRGICFGPVGIYICNGFSIFLSAATICMYISDVLGTEMMDDVVRTLPNSNDTLDLSNRSTEFQGGFYLLIPYVVLSIVAIVLVSTYHCAADAHNREQRKPILD